MGLQAVSTLADGTRVAGDVELRDIVRLLKHGDGLRGWEGDPNMEVMVNLTTGMFDLWTLDARGEPYIALSRPYCDHRLIDDVLAADTRRWDVAGASMANNEAVRAAADASFDEQVEAFADKLQWALRRDLGHHGGGTRMIHAIGGA